MSMAELEGPETMSAMDLPYSLPNGTLSTATAIYTKSLGAQFGGPLMG